MTSTFDARQYWETRLRADYTLAGVGLQRLGERFNRWAYQVRREVFLDLVRREIPDLAHARVLDIGSGTGFYLDRWREAGAADVSGLDLTDAAVDQLRARYPTLTIHRGDIGTDAPADLGLEPGSFDAVSAMDVLFHIVDDEAFARALANIRGALRPGGVFLWSDAFAHHQESRVEHRASRTLATVEQLVREAGFEVERRTPMFVLMNDPVDTRGPWARRAWKATMGVASLAEPLGGLVGWALYPLESRLVRTRSESPTTEIMVCRAREAAG